MHGKIMIVLMVLYTTICAQTSPQVNTFDPSSSPAEKILSTLTAFLLTNANYRNTHLSKIKSNSWQKIASICYNSGLSGFNQDSIPQWIFSYRDTMIYNADGILVVKKSSFVTDNWNVDNLISIDSSYIENHILVSRIIANYESTIDGYNFRTDYHLTNNNKSLVAISSDWIDTLNAWQPYAKDSMTFETALSMYEPASSNQIAFRNLQNETEWKYNDTTRRFEITSRSHIETNDTALIVSGKNASVNHVKTFMETVTFTSSDWSTKKSVVTINEDFDSNGAYMSGYKSSLLFDNQETFYESQTSIFNVARKKWNTSSFTRCFLDAYHNDTLTLSGHFIDSTNSWDTSYQTRSIRTYDIYGNNIETIESFYNKYSSYSTLYPRWVQKNKYVNTFSQINTPVLKPKQIAASQPISFIKTNKYIQFKGQDLTSLKLFTPNGKCVASINQEKAGSILFYLSQSKSRKLSAGTYFAQATSQNSLMTTLITITR